MRNLAFACFAAGVVWGRLFPANDLSTALWALIVVIYIGGYTAAKKFHWYWRRRSPDASREEP